jgi:hypothetical protein
MVVILTKEQGPLVLFGGIGNASFGRVWRVILWVGLSILEYDGVTRYWIFGGQFLGRESDFGDILLQQVDNTS